MQFFDTNGKPLNAGLINTYAAGSTTPTATYTTYLGNVANANPIVLGSDGRPSQEIWLTGGTSYTFVLTDSLANTIATYPYLYGINDPAFATQWAIASGTADAITATYVQPSTALVDGMIMGFRATAANATLTPTFSPDGLTARTITKTGGTSLRLGDIPGNLAEMLIRYNLSNTRWELLNPANPGGFPTIDAMGMYIFGNTYANNGSDATNDLDIAAGACVDATAVDFMICTALTKQSDAAWAVGTNAGGLDTGAVGNNDYYIWRIKRIDTGVVDVLYSLSSTAPTMPTNYTLKRKVGWFKRVGGTIVAFHTYETEGGGIEMVWDVPTLEINLSDTLTTTRRTDAVKVPLNFSVIALLQAGIVDAASAAAAWVCCPDQTDAAASFTAAPLANLTCVAAGTNAVMAELKVRTSAAGLIASRATLATVDLYVVSTMGFRWARRN